tara:strand:- start:283 stop:1272 length:990 start_codon:yes stop_codon:yes gene_type:complete
MPTGKLNSIFFGVLLSGMLAGIVMWPLLLFSTALGVISGVVVGLAFLMSGLFQLGQMEHGRPFFLGSIIRGPAFNESSRRPVPDDSDEPITPSDEPGGLFWRIPGFVQARVIPMKPFSFEVEDPKNNGEVPSLPTKDGDVKVEMTVQAVYTNSFTIFGFDESVRKTGLNNAILGSLRERLGPMHTTGIRKLRGELPEGEVPADEEVETFVKDIIDTAQGRIEKRHWPFQIISTDLDNITIPRDVEQAYQKKRVKEEKAEAEKIEIQNVIERMKQIKDEFPDLPDEMVIEIVADERGKMTGRRSFRIPGLPEASRALGESLRGNSASGKE